MKKNFFYAMMSAIALSGAVSFSACSSSDELTDVNPTYDGESVKTSFTISIGDVKSPTRMDADAAQVDELFNGMNDIYLIPATAAITSSTTFAQDVINLANFTNFDKYATSSPSTNAKIYNDVKLSVGVSHFLFYASTPLKDNGELKPSYLKVDKTAFNGTADWAASLTFNGNKTVNDITFDLVPYQKDKTISAVETAGANVVKVLNDMHNALTAQITAATTSDATSAELMQKKLNLLHNFVDADHDGIQDEGETTYRAYAGSALSVKALAEDMYNFGINLGNSYGTAICSAITGAGLTATASSGVYTLSWSETFPAGLNLPDGAVAVKYNATSGKFAYTDDVNIEGLTAPTISTYTHPARLYYTVNSPAKAKDAVYLKDLGGTELWSAVVNEYPDEVVKSSTRSVVMANQVQYAVGRLDVQVRVDGSENLMDSGSGIDGTSDKDPQIVSVPSAGYTLTGVLIGGQKQVGWDFKPKGSDGYTIWDGNMTTTISALPGTAYSAVNNTLALETASGTAVNIALEFVNTGNDFYGFNNNIIPSGTKFYLVAQLNPSSNVIDNPNNLDQVFKQDYVTTAKLTIHKDALKKAYNVIPDLRSPQLEFGLSVNLEWQKGITFEQTFQN